MKRCSSKASPPWRSRTRCLISWASRLPTGTRYAGAPKHAPYLLALTPMASLLSSCVMQINIHVGGLYGSKARAIDRFASSFESLSGSLRARLTVENDDRLNSYSVADLLTLNAVTGIPITFDFHHHQFCDGGMTQSEALEAALSTWPRDVRPVVHWSERPECPNLSRTHPHAHSKFVYGPMMLHGREGDVDVMIESKAKEVALLLYRDEIAPKQALAAAAAATAEAFASPDFMQRSSLQAGVA